MGIRGTVWEIPGTVLPISTVDIHFFAIPGTQYSILPHPYNQSG